MYSYVGRRPKPLDRQHLKVTPELPYPLPLSLQELCLLEVINDVDSYPVELLASLPRWLRCRLLSNLPAVDLCRLDSTAVARGVNTINIWKTRCVKEPKGVRNRSLPLYDISESSHQLFKTLFQLNIQGNQGTIGFCKNLKEEMTIAFEDLKKATHHRIKTVLSNKETYLLEITSNALSYLSRSELETIAHKLFSIRGDLLLHDLDANQRRLTDGQTIWNIQGNSLAISTCNNKPESTAVHVPADMIVNNEEIQLTPHRFIPICDTTNPLAVVLLLINTGTLKPSSVNLNVGPGGIQLEVRDNLLLRQIIIDSGSNPSSDCIDAMSILKFFLENIVILRLQSHSFTYIGVLISVLDAVTVRGNESQLKSLFCCLPNVYGEVIQPFTSLFSLPNFQLLHLDLDEVANPQMLIKLLQGFMIAPCFHSQQLVIDITCTGGFASPFFLTERWLASLDMGGATVPKCAHQHKTLRMSSPHLMEHMLQFLLLLPSIRLTELVLDSHNNSYVHLCACHPDIQVAKLRLVLNFHSRAKDSHILVATIKDDLISLLNKPNLQEIFIAGKWEGFSEAKLGLLLGLDGHPSHLKTIVFDVKGYSEEELKALWTTIFTFKQLRKLDIILGSSFRADLSGKFYRSAIYDSWTQLATRQYY